MTIHTTIRVAVPWLHDAIRGARASGSLPPLPAWSWLVGRGHDTEGASDWRSWLLSVVDRQLQADIGHWAAGPSLAAVAGLGASAPAWAIAQPVHLAAAIDHVRLAPLADAIPSPTEVEALGATLRAHFADGAFDFVGFFDSAWLVRCAERIHCHTHDPAALAGRNIHDHLPSGNDGARIRSLMNEVQMLLHDHPVNARRTGTRALPINALWLWGFGACTTAPAPIAAANRWTLLDDDLWLRSFWRARGGAERPLSQIDTDAGDTLVAVTQPPTTDPAESLAELDSSLFVRLSRAVQAGSLNALAIHDGARVHALGRHSRLRLWRRPARAEDL